MGERGTVTDRTDHPLRDKAAIVGVGYTEFSKASGVSTLTLALRAIAAAVGDAGLTVADVDGVVVVSAGLAPEVVQGAAQKAEKENGLRDALAQGSTLRDAYDRFGVL